MQPTLSKTSQPRPACPHRGRRTLHGKFYRKSDRKYVTRFRCTRCCKTFSEASDLAEVNQKKRQVNELVRLLLCSGVSQRRLSLLLGIHRITVARKLKFMAEQVRLRQEAYLKKFILHPIESVQFDEMETHEHTKLKPVSIALAVCAETRAIFGFTVSSMPAKGHLAKRSRKKYGPRCDDRENGMKKLFSEITPYLKTQATVTSDQNPKYPSWLKGTTWTHNTVKGRRGCIVGQGELKKIGFDPLFSLNHTCAMIRANVNRLFRKTWCTTKKISALTDHLALYMDFHNQVLI